MAFSAAWGQGLANGALEGKALLIATARGETPAFFGLDPRIQNLTSAGALDVLTHSLGEQGREVYQRHAGPIEASFSRQIGLRQVGRGPAQDFVLLLEQLDPLVRLTQLSRVAIEPGLARRS